jgi:hypothetical protein
MVNEAASFLNSLQVDICNIRADDTPLDYTKANIMMESLGNCFQVLNMLLSADDHNSFTSCVAPLKVEEMSQERVIPALAALKVQRGAEQRVNSGPAHVYLPCWNCGKLGRWRANCPEPKKRSDKGNENGTKNTNATTAPSSSTPAASSENALAAQPSVWLATSASAIPHTSKGWVLDSSACQHIMPSRAAFCTY